jgi:hypothetical protein
MEGKETTTHLRRFEPDALLIVSSGNSSDPTIAN